MAQIFSPYGLRVLKNLGEGYFTAGMHTYPVTNPSAIATTGCFFGDPVGLQGGSVVPLTASPTNVLPGVIGIFQGAEWQDPFRGFVNAQFLPPGIFSSGATQVKVKVSNFPFVIMRVQADGSVNFGPNSIGMNAALTGFGNGSTFTGNSRVYVSAASIAGGPALAVRIDGFVNDAAPSPGAGSVPGDAYTDLLVVWNFGIDRYLNAQGG